MFYLLTVYLDALSPWILVFYVMFTDRIPPGRDYIFTFILIQAVLNTLGSVLDQGLDMNNLIVYHVNALATAAVLLLYFKDLLENRATSTLAFISMGIIALFYGGNLLFHENLNTFNSTTYALVSIILVIFCLMFYVDKLVWQKEINITKSMEFWHVTGIFTYFVTCSFIFVSYRYLTQSSISNVGILWRIHNVIFLLMMVYFYIGYRCNPLPKRFRS